MTADVLCTLDLPEPFPTLVSARAALRTLGRLPGAEGLAEEMRDAVLGIVGFGRIGQAVARRALSFSMRIVYFDATDPAIAEDLREAAQHISLDALLREADIVSVHTPLTADTHHLIDAEALR